MPNFNVADFNTIGLIAHHTGTEGVQTQAIYGDLLAQQYMKNNKVKKHQKFIVF